MILIINGPNLNLLGKREPNIYGSSSLAELDNKCKIWAKEFGKTVISKQSNHEGKILDWLHSAEEQGFDEIIINPGAFGHSSIALRDAISSINVDVIEVHISNIYAREEFRQQSYISAVCKATISGMGLIGYKAAMLGFSS